MEKQVSPEVQKALDAAQALRDKAGEEAKKRGECFEQSKKEFETGDEAKAKTLSDEGKKHGELMQQYNKQAADAFFSAHNTGNDLYTIDLHGLFVEEALERVKARFDQIGRKGTLVIIWGAGNHSEGGVRKIKPAVIEVLNAEKIPFDDDTPNHGCCTAYFSGKATTIPTQPVAQPAVQPASKPATQPTVLPIKGETSKCSCCCVM